MLVSAANMIVNRLIERKIIKSEDKEIYQYGLEIILDRMKVYVVLFIIALAFEAISEIIVMVTVFSTLQTRAGGYHASSRLRCFAITICAIFIGLALIKVLDFADITYLLVIMIVGILLKYIAPIDTQNKRLDIMQKYLYRRQTLMVWMIQLIVAVICTIFDRDIFLKSITMAQIIVAGALIVEYIRGKYNEKEYKSISSNNGIRNGDEYDTINCKRNDE